MTTAIIITLCTLVLFAYIFDITSTRTRIPSVILLLVLGWVVRQIIVFLGFKMPDLVTALPVLGTIGLILIVLEGSLELEMNKSKLPVLKTSFLTAFLQMLIVSFILAYIFQYFTDYSYKRCLLNAIPLGIISSAVAIPSVKNLSAANREFIIYESSLSDILGVVFFNFVLYNEYINVMSFVVFFMQMMAMIVIAFVTTGALSYLLSKIEHSVKFIPIILLVILIYSISKIYHLPALLFIMIFGLFLTNLDELKHLNIIKKLNPEVLSREVGYLKDITIETTFLIRALFFLLFGYLVKIEDVLNPQTILWAGGIVAGVILIRVIQLKIARIQIMPLSLIAPRGLITILLFISIPITHGLPLVNHSLIIQVIILTALVMMLGLLFDRKKTTEETPKPRRTSESRSHTLAEIQEPVQKPAPEGGS